MYKYLSHSKKLFGTICACLFVVPLTLFASCVVTLHKPYSEYSEYVIRAVDSNDEQDVKWRDYLKNHLQKRSVDIDCVFVGDAKDDSQLQIEVDYDPNLKSDFGVSVCENTIRFKARTTEAMLWLQYQFISEVSATDNRFAYGDLPPATINCKADTTGNFAFEYRGIYSPSNTDADMMPILGINNVDFDWGLWGHNIRKVFSEGVPIAAKALVNGVRDDEQFCFASNELYKAYENFIIDNYGDGSDGNTTRFAVMPNDNGKVCQCELCRKLGNTPNSATPAVTYVVERLAKRFPHHMFFTSAYSTTKVPANHKMAANTGVIISAIDLPFVTDLPNDLKAKKSFEKTVEAWLNCTSKIYVWDYMRNFDDYITPFPCLHHLQNRLQYYNSLGVKGVFFNGSGYDYSSFDDVQTYTLAELLANPNASIDTSVKRYLKTFYPQTGNILSSYYLGLENKAKDCTLQIYAGIDEATKTYLNIDELYGFWTRLDKASKVADDSERTKLNEMLTSLAYTKLELMRQDSEAPDNKIINSQLELLSHHGAFEDLANYRESDGDIDEYINEWKTNSPWNISRNMLTGVTLKSLVELDGQNLDNLTDNKNGFISDYHNGWFITDVPQLILETNYIQTTDIKFDFSFMHAPKWHIFAPSSVEIWQENVCKAKKVVLSPINKQRVLVSISVKDLNRNVPIEFRINQTDKIQGRKTIACDEIMAN